VGVSGSVAPHGERNDRLRQRSKACGPPLPDAGGRCRYPVVGGSCFGPLRTASPARRLARCRLRILVGAGAGLVAPHGGDVWAVVGHSDHDTPVSGIVAVTGRSRPYTTPPRRAAPGAQLGAVVKGTPGVVCRVCPGALRGSRPPPCLVVTEMACIMCGCPWPTPLGVSLSGSSS